MCNCRILPLPYVHTCTRTQVLVAAPGSTTRARSLVGVVGDSLPSWLSHLLGGMFLSQVRGRHPVERRNVVRMVPRTSTIGLPYATPRAGHMARWLAPQLPEWHPRWSAGGDGS
jgi:hypothetical protein